MIDKLNIAICDDDPFFIDTFAAVLGEYLAEFDIKFQIHRFLKGESLIKAADIYDILFLDIKLGSLSGLDTARMLRERRTQVPIVFLTSYKQYVFEAFDVEAFHYLLKPITPQKLYFVVDRLLNRLEQERISYLTFKSGSAVHTIPFGDILYGEVMDRKIFIHTTNEVVEFYGKIQELEEKMQSDFFRCHRSYLVNLSKVKRFEKTDILLTNGETIPLSKRKYAGFSVAFFDYIRKDSTG